MSKWYKLYLAGLSRSEIFKLMNLFENYEDLFLKDFSYFKNFLKFKEESISKIFESQKINLNESIEKFAKLKISLISLKDDNYPFLLKHIKNPPVFLYLKGKIEFFQKSIAIVGTRRMSSYGKSATEKFAKELSKSKICIISGLALGVDRVAHETTINSNGKTIAVVGSGLDVIYPPENKKLWEKISNEHLIISEYPLGTEPNRWNFPERNRIIVGLSKGILLTESFEKGGALITAKTALEEGREVFAVPGFISYPSYKGCNNLIKNGEAKLVNSVEDILEEFSWEKEEIYLENNKFSKEENLIYSKLNVEKSIDELILDTKLKTNIILTYLTEMEIKGVVKSVSGGRYIRK